MSIEKESRARAGLAVLAVLTLAGVAMPSAAHAAGNPLLSNQASASGLPAGGQIYDSAMLGNGINPTGFLTFTLYGPNNTTCAGLPIFTTTTAVNGNGYYESARFTTNAAGTFRWIAVYGGDANNNPSAPTACSDPAGQVMVGKRTPLLSASPSWAPPVATDTAVLSSGSGPTGPTGTMTFNLYGPGNMTCAGAPIFVSTRTVLGNATYTSSPFIPSANGTYQWVVTYSGDANNFARGTICADTANGFTMATTLQTTVSGSPTTVGRGATITVTWSGIASPTSTDWVALYRVGTVDGGAVTAWRYTTGGAAGSVTLKFPWGATAGSYEIRLMANNSIRRLATSGVITMVW